MLPAIIAILPIPAAVSPDRGAHYSSKRLHAVHNNTYDSSSLLAESVEHRVDIFGVNKILPFNKKYCIRILSPRVSHLRALLSAEYPL